MPQLKMFCLFVVLFASFGVFALTPPAHPDILCSVEGIILRIEQTEASDAMMNRIMIPAALLEITGIQPTGKNNADYGCNMPPEVAIPEVFEGRKSVNHYRICDADASLKIGDKIKATVGRSLGGGPYCMEKIIIQ